MEISRRNWIALVTVMVVTGYAVPARADKSAVVIEAPDQAVKGTEIVVKLNVAHSANNPVHYTNWLHVKVNGKDTYFKDFSMFDRPESANFSREFKLLITEPVEIVAEANCNMHGSAGPARKKIGLKE